MILVEIGEFIGAKKTGARKVYPSVGCGPIDISKAKKEIGFVPTKMVSKNAW